MQIKDLVSRAYTNAVTKGFYEEQKSVADVLMQVVSEVSEALEAHRRGDLTEFRREWADVWVTVASVSGYFGFPVTQDIISKMDYNETRPPKHGKLY